MGHQWVAGLVGREDTTNIPVEEFNPINLGYRVAEGIKLYKSEGPEGKSFLFALNFLILRGRAQRAFYRAYTIKGLSPAEYLIYTNDFSWYHVDRFSKQCRPLYELTWHESAAKLGLIHELT